MVIGVVVVVFFLFLFSYIICFSHFFWFLFGFVKDFFFLLKVLKGVS